MNRPITLLGLLLAAALTVAPAAARPAVKGLSREDAALRSLMVSSVSYTMSFSLDARKPEYAGEETIAFVYAPSTAPLTLDFDHGTISALAVDGARVAKPDYNGFFVTLPQALLKPGRNELRVSWRRPYSETGEGLYRFKDPEDGRTYVYSDFEPFNANKLFPCFDQPDLKAAYTVAVDAPKKWLVVSTARESAVARAGWGRRRWTFPPTKPLSTYVFSLHAGEYAVWTSTAGDVPLRLFARRSLARYVVPEEWFDTTRRGLSFFGGYFGIPYPYGKYDQLIVPDYNAGAMENAGAVTFSERYVRRGARTRSEREDLAETILHEMAHMWFGDLVTPAWWDGLWLNESFASYMSNLAAERATDYRETWRTYSTGDKAWAYWEDQQPTTHPIENPVPDTESAFAAFDGITYGKGEAVLRQLAHLIGDDAFREGVRRYLASRSYGSATEDDFLAAIAAAGGTNLSDWRAQWLETTGVNATLAQWRCRRGRLAALTLKQDGGLPRPRKTDIALRGRDLEPIAESSVLARGEYTKIPGLAGKACPALVLVNAGDYDYAKTPLDPVSLRTALARLEKLPDPLSRWLVWHSLWEMVRDGELSAHDYGRAALQKLGAETDFETAKAVLQTIYGKSSDGASVLRYDPEADQAAFARLFWDRLKAAEPGSDGQKLWLDAFMAVAQDTAPLRALLDGAGPAVLDQDRRWDAIEELSALGDPAAPALIAAEAAKDRSESGANAALAARAAAPGEANKRAFFERVADPASKDTLGRQRAILDSLFPRKQLDERRKLAPEIFASMARLAKVKDDEYISAFAKALAPAGCTPQSAAALDAFAAAHPDLPAPALKSLRIAGAEDARCVQARLRASLARGDGAALH